MESESSSPGVGAALGRWWGQSPQPSPSTDVMNQLCRVCGEPAAGFHFGAFTCEGCKSFFGRTYNNLGSITECKNNGECVINKKNRTACKACRLRKCLLVGMSKSGSRYGRRSNWFKIHCLLQEQQQAGAHIKDKSAIALWGENYKNLTAPSHADTDSKGSPTEESIMLNNNNLSKEKERSPPTPVLPTYSAEAAAALWAARHSFFPMQLPHHPMPSLPMPFMPPFANFPPPSHSQSQRNMLLPFIQNLHSSSSSSPSPRSNHHPPLTVSSSPSRSSEGSLCSKSPSPTGHRPGRRSSSPVTERGPTERGPDRGRSPVPVRSPSDAVDNRLTKNRGNGSDGSETGLPSNKIAEEHSLALLRSLGPVQEQPMDLSVRVIEIKSRRKSKVSHRVRTESESINDNGEDDDDDGGRCDRDVDSDGHDFDGSKDDMSDSVDNNDENFNKRKNPLDLTKPAKLEI